ncbi:hypothetical protein SK128_021710 [Halocaridina rubra]|uniref:Peptidase S1 domain-containing protein n=1 Tax=Halocaridina rubra TaxID=373956 RepID=A0AAN9A2J2_HALRR
MLRKIALLLAVTAIASGNPAAGQEWHWKSPMPKVEAKRPTPDSRIIGGVESVPHAWPHQAALFIDGVSICGGTLISTEWILTAAHCMDQAVTVDVVLGAHNINEAEPDQVVITSTQFVVHGNWDYNNLANDVALLKLSTPAELNENIVVAPLPPATYVVAEGTNVTAIGWGRTSDSTGGISYVLREVVVPVTSTETCNDAFSIVNDNQICTDGTGGKGTCFGDAGSPLNYDGYIIGVTSFNAAPECEAGYPDVFAKASKEAAGKPKSWKSLRPLIEPKGLRMPTSLAAAPGCNEAVPHSFPHQVALFIDDLYFCTGALISTESVLAPAHCIDGASYINVIMGAHNLAQAEPDQVVMTSINFFVHEEWSSFTLSNDIGLIRLPAPVAVNANIAPAQLPTTDPPVGTIVIGTMWGGSGTNGALHQANVSTISQADCNAIFGIVTDNQMCTESPACCGNSPGLANFNGELLGLGSFASSAGCEDGYPEGYTKITSYLDWIEANTPITP